MIVLWFACERKEQGKLFFDIMKYGKDLFYKEGRKPWMVNDGWTRWTQMGNDPGPEVGVPKKPVFPLISGCFRLFPLILKGGGSRQNLPIWALRNRSPRVQGAAFCRLLPPSAAFSGGGVAEFAIETHFNKEQTPTNSWMTY
jgi:hypothetical protein